MRKQLPLTVLDIMRKDERVVVLLGDIAVHAFEPVFKEFPNRTFNIGILEQTMVGMAAGLSMAGLIPIVHTIEPFLVERAFEQIKDDFGYQNLIGTLIGVDVSQTAPNLGYTHQTPYAERLMKLIKNMHTFFPDSPHRLDERLKENYDKGLNYFRIS